MSLPRPSLALRLALVCAVLAAVGCAKWASRRQPTVELPLARPTMSNDSVALDMIFVRVSVDDPDFNEAIWQDIDEQALDAGARRRWAEHGFRVGLVGSRIPSALERLLPLGTVSADSVEQRPDLNEEQPVVYRHLQTRKGRRSEVLASPVYEQLPLLLPDGDEVVGRTYSQAQGVFALFGTPQGDGRVHLKLVPELHHGEKLGRLVYGEGRVRIEPGRARKVFEDLAIDTELAPGQMLLLTYDDARGGSVGRRFFTDDTSGSPQRKLLLIRIAQTQYDDRFSGDSVIPGEEADPALDDLSR